MVVSILVGLVMFLPQTYAANIDIDVSKENQVIEGFGGNMESHVGYANNTAFWDLLYKDIGVSAINIGGPINGDYTTVGQWWWDELTPVIREAKRNGVKTFVLIPTPKSAWKEGPDGLPGVVAGGTLKREHYANYANYMLAYIARIKSQFGVDAGYILPFPEPNWLHVYDPSGPWAYAHMTQAQYLDFIKVAGPIFQSSKTTTKMSVACGNRVSVTNDYARTILKDPVANQFVDTLVTNAYEWQTRPIGQGTDPTSWKELAKIAKDNTKSGTWVAEVSHFDVPNQMPAPHPAGIHTAKWLHEAVAYGNVSHYYWITMLDFGKYRETVRGLIYSKDFPCIDGVCEFTTDGITKVGYAFKQFAHWVRPGAVRVDATSDDQNVLVSAYKHQVDQKFTVVAINDSTQVKNVSVSILGLGSLSGLRAYRTSKTENSRDQGPVSVSAPVSGKSFSFPLPAESITTFTGSMSGTVRLGVPGKPLILQ